MIRFHRQTGQEYRMAVDASPLAPPMAPGKAIDKPRGQKECPAWTSEGWSKWPATKLGRKTNEGTVEEPGTLTLSIHSTARTRSTSFWWTIALTNAWRSGLSLPNWAK